MSAEVSSPSQRRRPWTSRVEVRVGLPATIAILGLAAWHYGLRADVLPRVLLPLPADVFGALVEYLTSDPRAPSGFYTHFRWTATVAVAGWLIGVVFGVLAAVAVSEWPATRKVLEPYIVAINGLPKVAIAPILALWFGFTIWGTISLVVLLTSFPAWASSVVGLRAAPPAYLELMRSLGAGRWETFRKVRLPAALPYVFVGVHLAAIYALIGAIVGEFVGADRGLGTLVLRETGRFNLAQVFALFLVFAVLGIALHTGLAMVRRRLIFWEETETDVTGL